MNFFNWLFTPFAGNATSRQSGDQSGIPLSSAVSSPKNVNEDTALQVSVVWACVKLLTETVSSLPLKCYSIVGIDKEEDTDSDLSRLICYSPNQYQTPMEFKENLMLNFCLHGNAYAQIERNGAGVPIALNPLPANQVKAELLDDGSIAYAYFKDTKVRTDIAVVAQKNMLHIKLFGNGVVGLSPIAHAKSTISGEIAAQDFASMYYTNAGRPSGTLTLDSFLTKEQRAQLKESFEGMTEGTANAHKLMVLEGGMTYTQIQLSPDDMQMIETRGQNLEDIARFWGIPSILINDNKDTTSWGSGIEQIMIGWLNTGLRPILKKWEQSLERSLVEVINRKKVAIRFDVSELILADAKGRAEYFTKLTAGGLMSLNEARVKLDLGKVDFGDKLYMQGAMTIIDNLQTGQNQTKVASQ